MERIDKINKGYFGRFKNNSNTLIVFINLYIKILNNI